MTMIWLELYCLAVVAFYVVTVARRVSDRRAFLATMAVLTVSSWIAEDTVIRLYGFYAYSRDWHLFVDQVPLLIVLIWPVVIHSAMRLLTQHPGAGVFAVAALVFTDAWLIEPAAVWAGLWHWTHPGLFEVPPIGVLGWALFTGFVLWLLRRQGGVLDLRRAVLATVGAPVLTHLALLACWWGFFRWVDGTIPARVGVAVAWLVTLVVAARLWKGGAARRVERAALWLRFPGALFFYALLAILPQPPALLLAWVAAFALPYLVLVVDRRA